MPALPQQYLEDDWMTLVSKVVHGHGLSRGVLRVGLTGKWRGNRSVFIPERAAQKHRFRPGWGKQASKQERTQVRVRTREGGERPLASSVLVLVCIYIYIYPK